jgi:hypothetical protein
LGMGKEVKAKSVETAMAAVAYVIGEEGGPADVRKTRATDLGTARLLQETLKAMREEDGAVAHHPPATAELILTIVRLNLARRRLGERNAVSDLSERTDDLIELAFLGCLRGGEYAKSPKKKEWLEEGASETIAFDDLTFFAEQRVVYEKGVWAAGFDLSDEDAVVRKIRNARVNFKDQKNGQQGHKMYLVAALDANGNRFEMCPVAAAVRIALSGRRQMVSPAAPIYMVGTGKGARLVTAGVIQTRLREILAAVPELADEGATSAELLTAHSLRSGGAMFYHCAGVDKAYIRILGRWKSDAIFCYLTERFPDAGGWAIQRAMENVGGMYSRGETRARGFTVVRLAASVSF